jgi:hypothetical protein
MVGGSRNAQYARSRCKPLQRSMKNNGASRTRTGDLLGAIQALSQLSYSPGPEECSFVTRRGPGPSPVQREKLVRDALEFCAVLIAESAGPVALHVKSAQDPAAGEHRDDHFRARRFERR